MKGDPTFWILARASGLTAYALVTASVLAGLLVKARPFGTMLRPAAATDLHRFVARSDSERSRSTACRSRPRHGGPDLLQALLVSWPRVYRPLPDRPRRDRGRVDGDRRRSPSRSASLIGAGTGAGCTGLPTRLRRRHGPRPRSPGRDTARPWALGLYLGAVGTVAAATAWRVLVPPLPPRPRGATT